MLRKIRISLAVVCFVFITLLFLDFTGTLHHWFGWLARIQFIPALLALNIGIVAGILLITLLFGRVYCSVICPLGVYQDGVSRLRSGRKKHRFSYSPAKNWLRYGVLVLYIIAFIVGISAVISLLDPYSAYGRIASTIFGPIYQWGNNLLAYFAERMDSYAFYSVDVWVKSIPTLLIAIITILVVSVLAWRNGRTYCNTICLVGTILGFVSRFSLFKPRFVESKCNQCGLCSRSCKASCINGKERIIDYSRCVSCMNCIESCNKGGIKYRAVLKPVKTTKVKEEPITETGPETGTSRRKFIGLATAFAVTSALKAQEDKVDGGLAIIEEKKIPKRLTPVKPPGSFNANNFDRRCTSCQLCVSVCPNQILRPSNELAHFMQPEMSFERGYCRPECTKCSEVCPSGAIRRIDAAEKSSLQIGHAVWISSNCVVNTDEVTCTACERHCPTGAIFRVPRDPQDPESLKVPVIDTERCIGCGACENLCPARPFSAIYVEGHTRHRTI